MKNENKKTLELCIKELSDDIAFSISGIKHKAEWQIEDIIYKRVGSNINQEDRLILAAKIFRKIINMPQSISDHYANILGEIELILKEYNAEK